MKKGRERLIYYSEMENCNFDLLVQQKEKLQETIIHGAHAEYFAVFDIEAGCQKTRTAEEALVKAWVQGKRSLLVRRTKDDCRESVKLMNQIADGEIAFAYNSEDVPVYQRAVVDAGLEEIPVVVITHEKYKVLMRDPPKQKVFTKGREILVVDEFLSSLEKIVLTENNIVTYRRLFQNNHLIYRTFEQAMGQLIDLLQAWNVQRISRKLHIIEAENSQRDFFQLNKLIQANVTREKLDLWKDKILEDSECCLDADQELLDSLETVGKLCAKLDSYQQMFGQEILYCDRKLFATDQRYQYWFLDNNIMLDASGKLQSAYSLAPHLFTLMHCEKVLDHQRWKIINIPVNTTASCKEKIVNFYDVVNSRVEKYHNDILVVGKKEEMAQIRVPEDNKGYFGNVTGSNQWYDKQHVAIIHTNNLSDVDYILQYLHYGRLRGIGTLSLNARCEGKKERRIYFFEDPILEEIRVCWIASEIYQAVKRVNRNMKFCTDILLFLKQDKVLSLLQEQMKNCRVEKVDYTEGLFEYENRKQEEYISKLKREGYAAKFVELLAEIQSGLHREIVDSQGRIRKAKIREYLGIHSSSNFSRKVLAKTEVIEYCQTRHIDCKGRYIKLPQPV